MGNPSEITVAEIQAMLAGNMGGLVDRLGARGKPSGRGHALRYGRKGSLVVNRSGPKRGAWFDHEAGVGGGPLTFIEHEHGCNFVEALLWARFYLGLESFNDEQRRRWRSQAAARAVARAEDELEEAARGAATDAATVEKARALWRASLPIGGTLAEKYLIETRKIPRPVWGWPESIRHYSGPDGRGLIIGATDDAGTIHAVQRTFLTDRAEKIGGRYGKMSDGRPDVPVAVRFPAAPGAGDVLQIAEGLETALTMYSATGFETWVSRGSLQTVPITGPRTILAAIDDDEMNAPSRKHQRDFFRKLRAHGFRVIEAPANETRLQDKSDFNDLAQRRGIEAVRARIEFCLNPKLPPRRTVPVAEARSALDEVLRKSIAEAVIEIGPDDDAIENRMVHAVRVSLGVGKSSIARRHAAAALRRMREAGDPRNIAVVVPTHALGEEAARSFEALQDAVDAGLKAEVWRGRTAKDPATNGDETMCRDLDAVEAAQDAGADVETACCKSGKGDDAIKCRFYNICGYQKQKAKTPDLWFVAHELLFSEKPAAIGEVAAVIVDEAPWSAGLEGVTGDGILLNLDALKNLQNNIPPQIKRDNRDKLFHTLGGLHTALSEQPDGPLKSDFLADQFLFRGSLTAAEVTLYDGIVDPGMRPGMPILERKERAAGASLNRTIHRTVRLIKVCIAFMDAPAVVSFSPTFSAHAPEPFFSGHAEMTFQNDARCVRMKGRREVSKAWRVPTILMDANLDVDLNRFYWPRIELVADIEAETPHMKIRQVVDRGAFGKTGLVQPKNEKPWNGRWPRKVQAAVLRQARKIGGRALVVANKGFIDPWRETGAIPAGVELANFNGIAGRDGWRDCALIVVIGRPMPRPGDVEKRSEALTGVAIAPGPPGGWYGRRDGIAGGRLVEADFHENPIAEKIRWSCAEAEVHQGIGRGRGANRTARDPLEVLVLGGLPLGIPTEAVGWDELNPNWCDLALSETGIALRSPTDAAAAAPELWQDKDSARSYQRKSADQVAIPLLDIPIGKSPHVRFIYQKAGPKQREAEGFADLEIVPDPKSWLEARLGPLAHFEEWSIQRLGGM